MSVKYDNEFKAVIAASLYETALESIVLLGGNGPLAVIAANALATVKREITVPQRNASMGPTAPRVRRVDNPPPANKIPETNAPQSAPHPPADDAPSEAGNQPEPTEEAISENHD